MYYFNEKNKKLKKLHDYVSKPSYVYLWPLQIDQLRTPTEADTLPSKHSLGIIITCVTFGDAVTLCSLTLSRV